MRARTITRVAASALLACAVAFAAGCAGSSKSSSKTGAPAAMAVGTMTYDDAVRSMGRPPSAVTKTPQGDTIATWITETSAGRKHLILTFGKDRVLKDHREEVR